MKKKLFKAFLIICLLMFSLTLVSCSGSGASKGYKIRKEETKNFYVSNGLPEDTVIYDSCQYVKVVRDGSKDVYFYKANYTTLGRSYIEFFTWIDGDSSTEDSSEFAFNLAYKQVSNGEANGETGTVN